MFVCRLLSHLAHCRNHYNNTAPPRESCDPDGSTPHPLHVPSAHCRRPPQSGLAAVDPIFEVHRRARGKLLRTVISSLPLSLLRNLKPSCCPVKVGCLEWPSEDYLKSGGLWVSGSRRVLPRRSPVGEISEGQGFFVKILCGRGGF